MATDLAKLKFNLQEREYPYFTDEDLQMLLENNDLNVKKASYQGCLMKASANDGMEVAGIKLSSNRDYWLTLAKQFNSGSNYKTSMQRADGI